MPSVDFRRPGSLETVRSVDVGALESDRLTLAIVSDPGVGGLSVSSLKDNKRKTGNIVQVRTINKADLARGPGSAIFDAETNDDWHTFVYVFYTINVSGEITSKDQIECPVFAGGPGVELGLNTGIPGTDRLLLAVLLDEGSRGEISRGFVNIDGKLFTPVKTGDSSRRVGNHIEIHTIEESALFRTQGVQDVAFSSADEGDWYMWCYLFTGVKKVSVI